MSLPPPLLPRLGGRNRSALSPVAFSALVCPGAGQFVQRRWLAGFLFFVTSTLALVWFVRVAYIVIKAYYGLAFDPMNAPAEIPGPLELMLPFAVWLAVYVAGIVDTAQVSWRKR